jgi:hypothetical protein
MEFYSADIEMLLSCWNALYIFLSHYFVLETLIPSSRDSRVCFGDVTTESNDGLSNKAISTSRTITFTRIESIGFQSWEKVSSQEGDHIEVLHRQLAKRNVIHKIKIRLNIIYWLLSISFQRYSRLFRTGTIEKRGGFGC